MAANLAAAAASKLAHSEYNVGTGTEISVLELVHAVATAAGVGPEGFAPRFAPARSGEVVRSCLDITRAKRELDLLPPTPLSTGLVRTLKAFRGL